VTAKRRLVPEKEVRSMAELLRTMGFRLDGPVEIRADSVVFHPMHDSGGDAYERWSRENKGRD
jgi:hypothetical protein